MRPRLVFIDDDPQELNDFEKIVCEDYDYTQICWPMDGSLEQNIGAPPAIFVLDLYFPPANGIVPVTISETSRVSQAAFAEELSRRIAHLYDDVADGSFLKQSGE